MCCIGLHVTLNGKGDAVSNYGDAVKIYPYYAAAPTVFNQCVAYEDILIYKALNQLRKQTKGSKNVACRVNNFF